MLVNDLRPGITFIYKCHLFVVIEQSFSKSGRQQGKVSIKAKNLKSGSHVEITFTSGEKVDKAIVEKKDMQYLYNDKNYAYLMDTNSYEQLQIPMSQLKWEKKFLTEGLIIKITEYNGEIIEILLPDKVKLKIIAVEDAVKGDTTSSALKKAILQTGLKIMVPLFINIGINVIVSISDEKYIGRA